MHALPPRIRSSSHDQGIHLEGIPESCSLAVYTGFKVPDFSTLHVCVVAIICYFKASTNVCLKVP